MSPPMRCRCAPASTAASGAGNVALPRPCNRSAHLWPPCDAFLLLALSSPRRGGSAESDQAW
eukprot:scaffold1565_cov215-Prasinococcus_capsulatus_cf.AAC.1